MAGENQPDKDGKEPENGPDVDRGFAWIVLAGSFFIYMFILGSLKSYGVLYTEMVEHFSSGSGNTAWIGSIAWLFMLSLGPVANVLSKRFGFRKVTITGGVLAGTGYFLSGFVKKMELMYLTYTICGIGYGLSYLPSATIINFYFKKRRALANGIQVSSGGIAAVALPFLYKFLIEKYGLSQTFWILGAIVSNICVAGCVFRQPPSLVKNRRRNQASKDSHRGNDDYRFDARSNEERDGKRVQEKEKCSCGELDFKFSLLKNPLFAMYVVAFTVATFGHVNNSVLIPAHIKALGYDKTHVALGVSITGGVELIARIVFGWFTDLNIVKRKNIFIVSMFIGGIFAFITPLFKSFTYMAIYAAVVSAFPASFLSLIPVLTIEVVGIENFPPAYGIICLGMAFACAINSPIAGWMEDYFGNWNSAFILTGSMFLLAGITVLMEPAIARIHKTTKDIDNNQALANQERNQDPESQEIQTQENIEGIGISSHYKERNQGGKTNLAFIHENDATVYGPVKEKQEKQPVRLLLYKNRIGN